MNSRAGTRSLFPGVNILEQWKDVAQTDTPAETRADHVSIL